MKRLFTIPVFLGLLMLLASCSDLIEKPKASSSGIFNRSETTQQTDETVLETMLPETVAPGTLSPEPSDNDFVHVIDYIPDLVVDLKYACRDNFTGHIIYGSEEAWLRYGTVKKLVLVQNELAANDLSLKLWDGFRPPAAQFKLWEICPDPTYVSDPNNGFSNHSRGNTVDITLVDMRGNEVTMPTGFDDFSEKADRDYSDCTEEAAANARFLEQIMVKYGFKGYYGEWWHYTDTDSYEVEHDFLP